MQHGTLIQVTFMDLTIRDDKPLGLRTGELVNPFTIDELGVNVVAEPDAIDVLCRRSNGADEIFRITQAQVDTMNVVRRVNGQWVVVG